MTGQADTRRVTRNLSKEKTWLKRAELDAGAASFAAHTIARLEAGGDAYGERWAELGLERLISELGEEAADLGGWGVLALQALDLDHAVGATRRASIGTRLHAAILAGARAHRQLELACVELERARAEASRRTFTPDVDGRCLKCGRTYGAHPGSRCHHGVDELDATRAT